MKSTNLRAAEKMTDIELAELLKIPVSTVKKWASSRIGVTASLNNPKNGICGCCGKSVGRSKLRFKTSTPPKAHPSGVRVGEYICNLCFRAKGKTAA